MRGAHAHRQGGGIKGTNSECGSGHCTVSVTVPLAVVVPEVPVTVMV
jgi:hypothetical protein